MSDKRIKSFLKTVDKEWKGYANLVEQLELHVKEKCSLQLEQHPIVNRLDELKAKDAKWVIQEYSRFSNEAIHMLLDARIRAYDWRALAEEIDRNIEEEKGSKTGGVPHLQIMRKGYLFGLQFDSDDYKPSHVTTVFLSTMRRIFQNPHNAYLAGAVLAFESVSIPEFQILDKLVAKSGANYSPSIRDYVDGHKLFEVGHKQELMKAIEPYIDWMFARDFAKGYLDVCIAMSDWWESLNQGLTDRKMLLFLLTVMI
jgi:hypothetical protein